MQDYIKITRPHKKASYQGWTGLSRKLLGQFEYARQLRQKRIEVGLDPKPDQLKPRWSGLSLKLLGRNEYQRRWNQLRKQKARDALP